MTKSAASSPITGGAGTCSRDEPGLGCRSSSDNALSMKENPRARWGFLHTRNMASGQEVPSAQATKTLRRPQDGSCCVSRSGQENPIQTRPARLPPLPSDQTRWTPLRATGSERTPGVRSAWRLRHAGHAGEVSAVRAKRGVQGRHSRRTIAASAVRSHALAALPGG